MLVAIHQTQGKQQGRRAYNTEGLPRKRVAAHVRSKPSACAEARTRVIFDKHFGVNKLSASSVSCLEIRGSADVRVSRRGGGAAGAAELGGYLYVWIPSGGRGRDVPFRKTGPLALPTPCRFPPQLLRVDPGLGVQRRSDKRMRGLQP